MKIYPTAEKLAKVDSKFCQILNTFEKNRPKDLKISQSGRISSNLVTLYQASSVAGITFDSVNRGSYVWMYTNISHKYNTNSLPCKQPYNFEGLYAGAKTIFDGMISKYLNEIAVSTKWYTALLLISVTRRMNDFDTFTKIAWQCGRFGQTGDFAIGFEKLPKVQ